MDVGYAFLEAAHCRRRRLVGYVREGESFESFDLK
jgi:hypothetical protein